MGGGLEGRACRSMYCLIIDQRVPPADAARLVDDQVALSDLSHTVKTVSVRQRLYPTHGQVAGLVEHCHQARFVFNIGLQQRSMWRRDKHVRGELSAPRVNAVTQMRELAQLRGELPWLAAGPGPGLHELLRRAGVIPGVQAPRRPSWRVRGPRHRHCPVEPALGCGAHPEGGFGQVPSHPGVAASTPGRSRACPFVSARRCAHPIRDRGAICVHSAGVEPAVAVSRVGLRVRSLRPLGNECVICCAPPGRSRALLWRFSASSPEHPASTRL